MNCRSWEHGHLKAVVFPIIYLSKDSPPTPPPNSSCPPSKNHFFFFPVISAPGYVAGRN